MGYQNKAVAKGGWNLISATFERVDGKDVTLADVSVNDLFTFDNGDTVQFLDEGGGTRVREDGYTAEYSYFPEDIAGTAGWYSLFAAYDGEFLSPEAEDDFTNGAGAVIQTVDKDAALLFSGAVHKGPATIGIAKSGWNIVGNPTPCDLTLADIAVNDAFTYDNGDTIQFLDEGGGTKVREDGYTAEYSYFPEDIAGTAGWYSLFAAYDGEFLSPDDDDNNISAGTAFVVQTVDKTAALQFKAALPAED